MTNLQTLPAHPPPPSRSFYFIFSAISAPLIHISLPKGKNIVTREQLTAREKFVAWSIAFLFYSISSVCWSAAMKKKLAKIKKLLYSISFNLSPRCFSFACNSTRIALCTLVKLIYFNSLLLLLLLLQKVPKHNLLTQCMYEQHQHSLSPTNSTNISYTYIAQFKEELFSL